MAELKLPEKNNPSSFNAGANLKNNNVPTADQKVKKMSTGETGSDKGEDLKNSVKNGADGLKRNLKKEAIAIGVQALSSGAVDRSVTKQALNNKLGDKLVDSIQTPTEKYRSNKEKIRQKRIANDEEPDYPMLWFDALPASMKILLIFGILLFIGLMFFVSIFVTLFEDDSMMKAQSFGYISSQNIGNKISNITNRESSLADKFKSIFGMFITKDFDNIGNVFSNDSVSQLEVISQNDHCSGVSCLSPYKNRIYTFARFFLIGFLSQKTIQNVLQ